MTKKNSGKIFEEGIRDSVIKEKDVYFYRLRDSASSFNPSEDTGLRFTPKNDYDCLFYMFPHFFPTELKSTKDTSFSIQMEKKEKSKMIKLHQIEGLTKASEVEGVCAGFLFNFSDKGRTYWLDIKDFNIFLESTTKKSINEKDMIEHNAILVEQTLKRVKYKYNVRQLLIDVSSRWEFKS